MKERSKSKPTDSRWNKAELRSLIDEAIADAHDEEEVQMGFFSLIEDTLKCPFFTMLFGAKVSVERVELNSEDESVAVCTSAGKHCRVRVLDLSLADPLPPGAKSVEAYRLWKRSWQKDDPTGGWISVAAKPAPSLGSGSCFAHATDARGVPERSEGATLATLILWVRCHRVSIRRVGAAKPQAPGPVHRALVGTGASANDTRSMSASDGSSCRA